MLYISKNVIKKNRIFITFVGIKIMGILFSREAIGPVHEILISTAYAPIPQLISIICTSIFSGVYSLAIRGYL